MLRKIFLTVTIILLFLLQTVVLSRISILFVTPNLLLAFCTCYGLMKGKKSGMYTGLVCGILMDVFFGSILGFYALFMMLFGHLSGYFHKRFFPDEIKLPLLMVFVEDLLMGCAVYVFLFLFRGKFMFGYYFINIMIPEAVFTTLVSLLIYPVIIRINTLIEEHEKRRAIKFG